MVRLALFSALSDRHSDGKVLVVDDWGFTAPKTRDAMAALTALGVTGRALVVLDRDDLTTAKSFRNIPSVHVLLASELNAYDVLVCDWVIFTRANLPTTGPLRANSMLAEEEPALVETPVVVTETAPTDAIEDGSED